MLRITTCHRNVWPPCCDVLRHVVSISLRMVKFEGTIPSLSLHVTTGLPKHVTCCAQHSCAVCCVDMLRSFGRESARARRKTSVFFKTSNEHKNNLQCIFSPFLRRIWQTGSKHFTLVGARSSGKPVRPVFFAAVRILNLRNLKGLPLTNPTFLCLKFVSQLMRCAVKMLEDFTEEN